MARIELKGDYEGPGEQKTAEFLAENLPDSWVIFVGRKLPGANRDDVDLIVVADHLVFVIEEKSWGPRMVVADSNWYVNGEARPNPLNRVAALARKLAGLLRARAKGYQQLRGHHVVPMVILSHDDLHVLAEAHHDPTEIILPLVVAPQELMSMDRTADPGIRPARESVLRLLSDMPRQGPRPERLGAYVITGRVAALGIEVAYEATAEDGSRVVLKCYDIDELSEHGDPRAFLQRETKALNILADTGRTWRAQLFFESPAHRLFVVPLVPPNIARNLETSVKREDPERPHGRLDEGLAAEVVMDAFRGLGEVHELGLTHRALHPSRVWLGRGLRVMFSDFYLARIDGDESIGLWAPEAELGDDFRAPECAADIRMASPASDVYALSQSLIYWLLGVDIRSMSRADVESKLGAEWPVLAPWLLTASAVAETDRPSAKDVAEGISSTVRGRIEPSIPDDDVSLIFDEGTLLDGRYELRRPLGRGGFANTWLAYDQRAQRSCVIKQYRRALPDEARREFNTAQDLRHDRCGRVFDLQVESRPPFLVCEYIDGLSLSGLEVLPSIDQLRNIACDIAEALDYIHSKHLVHGDVTPSNIVVSNDMRRANLIDFGLSVAFGQMPYGGNPKFMAPEIAQGHTISAASDIYGLAASVLSKMLGRVPLVEGEQRLAFESAISEAELRQWVPEGTALLRALLEGLHPDATHRPQSAAEFRNLIQGAIGVGSGTSTQLLTNPTVDSLRRLYRASKIGNAGNRGLDDEFAKQTYVPTLLDTLLAPRILAGEFDFLLLTGNPGDGKTSFLVQLAQVLKEHGARELSSDAAGWTMQLESHTFIAVYDASESHGSMSSDELMISALKPVIAAEGKATALIAVNDGRLLQFFDEHDEFEDLGLEVRRQALTGEVGNPRVALVDLKRRSLAAIPGEDGLAAATIDALTAAPHWSTCQECSAQVTCPIWKNRELLCSGGDDAFNELVLTSHLRRRRRATFRDVRSAAAWLLTGDMACADVHDAIRVGRDPQLTRQSRAYDLAFSSESGDYLVDEWADIDPGATAAPLLDALRRLGKLTDNSPTYRSTASAARALFFEDWSDNDAEREHVRAYRYLSEFLGMLIQPTDDSLRRILLGISRLVGAPGFTDVGLAVSSGLMNPEWTVLHVIPPQEFALEAVRYESPYVESIPDRLILKHTSGAALSLQLDTIEIVLRASDGEVINDVGSDAVLQEIDGFVGQLRRQPAQTAKIVDSAGTYATVVVEGAQIKLEGP